MQLGGKQFRELGDEMSVIWEDGNKLLSLQLTLQAMIDMTEQVHLTRVSFFVILAKSLSENSGCFSSSYDFW